jgi:hypothetical protein
MSQIETAVTMARRLETLLVERFQADGRGLHEKLTSVEEDLPKALAKQIRYVASIRNSVVHEDGFNISDLEAFVVSANAAIEQLSALPARQAAIARAASVKGAEWLTKLYRAIVLAGILVGGGFGVYAGGVGLGIATALGGGFLAILAISDEAIALYKNTLMFVLGLILIGAGVATIATIVSVFR